MFYTLLMSGDNRWQTDMLELAVLRDHSLHHENLCCIVRGSTVIGFRHGIVDNLDEMDDMVLLHRYNYDIAQRRILEVKNVDFAPLRLA